MRDDGVEREAVWSGDDVGAGAVKEIMVALTRAKGTETPSSLSAMGLSRCSPVTLTSVPVCAVGGYRVAVAFGCCQSKIGAPAVRTPMKTGMSCGRCSCGV